MFVYAIIELFKQDESFQEFSFVFVSFYRSVRARDVVLSKGARTKEQRSLGPPLDSPTDVEQTCFCPSLLIQKFEDFVCLKDWVVAKSAAKEITSGKLSIRALDV